MVTGQRPVSPYLRELDSLPRCTSGSFPRGQNWLTVVLDMGTKSEFGNEALPQ